MSLTGVTTSRSDFLAGRGTNAWEQNAVYVRGYVDVRGINSALTAGKTGKAMYQASSGDNFSFADGDVVFTMSAHRALPPGATADAVPLVRASLNGMGALAVALFPNDELMQREALLNEIKPVGRATSDTAYATLTGRQPGIAIQTHGVKSHVAHADMPPAYLEQIVPPLPSSLADNTRVHVPYALGNTVKLETRPYNPQTMGKRALTHISNALTSRDNWLRVMNPALRQTHAWAHFVDAEFRHALASFVFGVYAAIVTNVIDVTFRTESPFSPVADANALGALAVPTPAVTDSIAVRQRGRVAYGEAVATALGSMTGLIDLRSARSAPAGVDAVKLSTETAKYDDMRRQWLLYIMYDGRHANFAFGHRDGAANPNISAATGAPLTSSASGQMLREQMLHVAEVASGFSNAVRREDETITGKIVKGTVAGGKVDVAM